MDKKYIIFGIMFLLTIGIVSAIDYEINSPYTIYAEYTVNGIFTNSSAYLYIEAPNGTIVLLNESMNESGIGKFYYTGLTPENSGTYFYRVNFYDNNTLLGTDSQYINIGLYDQLILGTCPDTKQGQTNMWIVVLLVVVVGLVGIIIKNIPLTLISGFGLIFMTLIVWNCGAIIAYITILFGVIYLLTALSIKH